MRKVEQDRDKKIDNPGNFEIGFADSNILSYTVKDGNLSLILECWNSTLVQMTFIDVVVLFAMDYCRISDFREIFESPLLERALNELYEIQPAKHDYRIFKFLNPDNMTALEIVCENIEIKKI